MEDDRNRAAAPAWRFSLGAAALDARVGFNRDFAPRAREALGIEPGMRVLELGSGRGAFTRLLAEAMDGRGEIDCVDHDGAALANARDEPAVPPAPGPRLRHVRADALRLPFADASFDAVVSQFLLCILPDPLPAIRETVRVAKPGAVLASMSCFCKSGLYAHFLDVTAFDGGGRLAELYAKFRTTYRERVRNPGLSLPNGRDLDVWADHRRAGVEDLAIRGFMTVLAPSDARWTDADAVAFVRERRRIDLALIDRLSPEQVATLERHAFPKPDVAELRGLLERRYEWLLSEPRRIREASDVLTDPAVLITGRRSRRP